MVGISLSRATADLYFIRRPESVTDWLPVELDAKLDIALATRFFRVLLLGFALLIARYLLVGDTFSILSSLLPIAVLCLMVAVTELFAAFEWVRWNHKTRTIDGIVAIASVILSISISAPLLLETVSPNQIALSRIVLLMIAGFVLAIGLFIYLQLRHRRYRSEDIEYARRLWQNSKFSFFNIRRMWKRFDPAVVSLLSRDLQLTLRVFSSAIYMAIAVVVLCAAILATLLWTNVLPVPVEPRPWLDLTWLPAAMATKFAVIIATNSLSVLAAALVVVQLPNLWVEKTVGTNGLQMWEAKVWYARIVSLPAPFLMTFIAIGSGKIPFSYAMPLFLECLFLWFMSSSAIGALAYEMPDQPLLASIVMFTVGISITLLPAIFWPAGIIIYVSAIGSLTGRGRERARVYLLTETL